MVLPEAGVLGNGSWPAALGELSRVGEGGWVVEMWAGDSGEAAGMSAGASWGGSLASAEAAWMGKAEGTHVGLVLAACFLPSPHASCPTLASRYGLHSVAPGFDTFMPLRLQLEEFKVRQPFGEAILIA